MKVKYSPDFKILYSKLPQSIQRQFQVVDQQIKDGKLTTFKKMGWGRFVDINGEYAGLGSEAVKGVFYWIWVGTSVSRPDIL